MLKRPVKTIGSLLVASAAIVGSSITAAQPAQALGLAGCENGYKEKTCIYIDSVDKEVKKYAYRDSIENNLSESIKGKCAASNSETWTFKLSIEVSSKIGNFAIGEVSASVTGSVQKETKTGYVTSATFRVPAHGIVYCDRGAVIDYFSGHIDRTLYGSEGNTTTHRYYTGHAPEAARWWIH